MLTLFAVPKPFAGHIGIIQRNAIESWTRLEPRPEIILFGDEPGTAEVCREFGLRHEPQMARSEFGAPMVDDVFGRASKLASFNVLAYVNADIILLQEFCVAAERVSQRRSKFLMVGRRTDLDIVASWDFNRSDWSESLKNWALSSGKPRPPNFIDYFVFTRDLAADMLPLALGRVAWDNWLIWHALAMGAPVLDASRVVTAIHQNHDYSHHPQGIHGAYFGEEAKRNSAMVGPWKRSYSTAHATHVLCPSAIQRNWFRSLEISKCYSEIAWFSLWFEFLNLTRPIRRRLGLRSKKPIDDLKPGATE